MKAIVIGRIMILCVGVICFISLVSCTKDRILEHEPNDTPQNANMIFVDRAVVGYLSTASDQDYYYLDIAESSSFEITLSAVKGVNHAIEIFRGNANSLTSIKLIDDNRKSSPEMIRNIWFEKDRYYILIKHGDRDEPKGNDEDSYTLFVKLQNQSGNQEKEPDDSFEDAQSIDVGNEYTGFYSPAMNKKNPDEKDRQREEDWYSFVIDPGADPSLVYDFAVSGVPGVQPQFAVYNESKTVIFSSEADAAGNPISLPGHGLTPGKYFIALSSHGYETNPKDSYTLSVKSHVHDQTSEREPNNSVAEANTITDKGIHGTIFPSGDHDFFVYDCSDESLLKIESVFPADIFGNIRVFDEQNNILADSGIKAHDQVIPSIYCRKRVFIELWMENGKMLPDQEYVLSVVKSPINENAEIEPNNDLRHAQKLQTRRIDGFINTKNDKDYYLIETKKQERKKISVQGIPSGIIKVSVTDPDGYVIRTEKVIGDKTVVINELIDGKGYIVVEAVKEIFSQPYILRVEE